MKKQVNSESGDNLFAGFYRSIKVTFINVILLIFFVTFILVVAFLFSDFFSKKPYFMPDGYKGFHPLLGVDVVPNFEGVVTATGETIYYSFGGLGERLPPEDFRTDLHEQPCSVLTFGDSETVGFGLHYDETWPGQLERMLNSVRVCNFAVDGYGIDQYYLKYLEKQKHFDRPIVVVYLPHFGNERHMHFFRWGTAKPVFTEDPVSGALILQNSHVKPSVTSKIWQFMPKIRRFSDYVIRLVERFETKYQEVKLETEFTPEEVSQRALKIARKFAADAEKNGSEFYLISSVDEFCDDLAPSQCFYFRRYYDRDFHITKLGYNTRHLNPEGQGRLAELIFKQVFTDRRSRGDK